MKNREKNKTQDPNRLPSKLMTSLLSLPEPVLFGVLDEWLTSWRDVLALDSAVCNKLLRPHFLDSLRYGLLRSKWTPLSAIPFQHAKSRDLRLVNVKITLRSSMHLIEDCVQNKHLKGLEFHLNEKFDLGFVGDMIFKCPGLEVLTIHKLGTFRSNDFYSNLPGDNIYGLLALTKLHLIHVEAMHNEDLCLLTSMAPNLQELFVSNCASVTGNGIFTAIKHLAHLHTLRTSRMEPTAYIHYDPEVSAVSEYHWQGQLQSLIINEVIAPRDYILTLIHNNPLLTHLEVMYLERGQSVDVVKILEVLPCLHKLFIGGVMLSQTFFTALTTSNKACLTLQNMRTFTVTKTTRQESLRCEVGKVLDDWKHFLSHCQHITNFNLQVIYDDAALSALLTHFVMVKTLRYLVIKSAYQVSDEAFKPLLTKAAEDWLLLLTGKEQLQIVLCDVPGVTSVMKESLKKMGVKIIA